MKTIPAKRLQDDLVRAVCDGDVGLMRTAISRGANVNARYLGRPIMLWAIQEGHLNVVKILVFAGASLERKDSQCVTPLDQAVGSGNLKIVQFLLDAGANVNGRTSNGSALHTACAYRRLRIVRLLLKRGASPLATDDEGRKPVAFVEAAKTNRTDVTLRNLLQKSVSKEAVKPKKKDSGRRIS